ncbi:hypothetical protein J437_LFUL012143, partial [Ladona fulva]
MQEALEDDDFTTKFTFMPQVKVYGSFFLCEKTVAGKVTWEFCSDWAAPHWNDQVYGYLNDELSHPWIEHVGDDDLEHIKNLVYVTTANNICRAQGTDQCCTDDHRQMLQNVWNEVDYCLYMYHVTHRANIECNTSQLLSTASNLFLKCVHLMHCATKELKK